LDLLRVATWDGHVLAVMVMVVMMVVIASVMMMVVVMVPANYEKTAVMMMVMMILRHLYAIGAFRLTLRTGGVIGIEKRYSIRNRRQKIGV
jgi:hypothetical protein